MSGKVPTIFGAWPEGLKVMLAVDAACDATDLSDRLLELVRLWCSALNECTYCIAMHRHKAAELGVPAIAIEALVERQDTRTLDASEQAAFAYASALTVLTDEKMIAETFTALSAHFDRQQLIVLTYTIAQTNAWNRLLRANSALAECLNK